MKVILQLKHQKQHAKPMLKIAEKPNTFFAMALFYVRYCTHDASDNSGRASGEPTYHYFVR